MTPHVSRHSNGSIEAKETTEHKARRNFYHSQVSDSVLKGLDLGPSIPSGLIVCENCGHIELFALGSLGLLKKKGDNSDGE